MITVQLKADGVNLQGGARVNKVTQQEASNMIFYLEKIKLQLLNLKFGESIETQEDKDGRKEE